jgi:hypothetical protein
MRTAFHEQFFNFSEQQDAIFKVSVGMLPNDGGVVFGAYDKATLSF